MDHYIELVEAATLDIYIIIMGRRRKLPVAAMPALGQCKMTSFCTQQAAEQVIMF